MIATTNTIRIGISPEVIDKPDYIQGGYIVNGYSSRSADLRRRLATQEIGRLLANTYVLWTAQQDSLPDGKS